MGLAAAAVSLSLADGPLFGQARGAAAPPPPRPAARPARIAGKPNLNGIWQAIGTAHWNLEDHSASATPFWQLGAIVAVPAGQSVVEGGTIPYLPAALKKREENMEGWPKSDPEAKCYMPGIPRATYMPYPFQIVQGQTRHPVRLRVRQLEPHRPHEQPHRAAGRQLDGLVERQVGRRHAGDRGQRATTIRPGSTAPATTTPRR